MESEMYKYIQSLANCVNANTPKGWFFCNLYELMLATGREFDPKEADYPNVSTRGNQECFMNCFLAVMVEPQRYTYVEGYAVRSIIPVHHAWMWDKYEYRVIDVTWDECDGYLGVPIQKNFLMEAMAEGGKVFDRWENGWPTMQLSPEVYAQDINLYEG